MIEIETSLPSLCNRRRVWQGRGREVVAAAFPRLCISSCIVILFTACGLSWFFPPLGVFHVTPCVSTLFLSFCVYFVHTFSIRLWPNILRERISTGIGFRRTIQTTSDAHRKQIHYRCHRLLQKMGGSKSTTGQHRDIDGEIFIRIYMVSVRLSDRTHKRPRRTLPQPSRRESHNILCGSPQAQYALLPTGKRIGRIHKQNAAKHTPKICQ